MIRRRHSFRAFTLLELLISLALMAALFLALNQFVFSMGELWGHGAQRRLFERHASAVAHHLQGMLQSAASRTADTQPVSISDAVSGMGGADLLTMELPNGDRVFPWVGQVLPDVICGIHVQSGQGLILRWVSRLEPEFQNKAARMMLLTPFAQRIDYEYYNGDAGSWASFESPQKDQQGRWLVPARLKVYFAREGQKTIRTVMVPGRADALPAF